MANRSSRYNEVEDLIKFYQGDLKDLNFLSTLGRFDVLTVNPP